MQIRKAPALFLLLFILTQQLTAQSYNPWSPQAEADFVQPNADRKITPQVYRTFALDVQLMRDLLVQAPLWHSQDADQQGGAVIALPMPDGSFQRFQIVEAPVMHPDLQAKYPDIRTYAGIGIDDPAAYFRGDFTVRGFHGMIRSPQHSTVYIDPYAFGDIAHYQVYYRKDFTKADSWACRFDEVNRETQAQPAGTYAEAVMAGDCVKRTYTLALACTGEYATFHGGTVAQVLSAFNTTMARVNGVFEQDASVTMVLHPSTSSLIFLNASTDPYTNTDGSAMLTQNQTTCDNTIGNANYDIGHVFSTGGGGVAYLGAVCTNSLKAGGVTGQPNPIGDPFDIDYVAHEMGHQYGANHTQNNNCNRAAAAAHEPGSASTIMGYAGICAPNVQNNSDDYFHAYSIQEIAAEVTSNAGGGGNTCSTNSTINTAPTANAGLDYIIPRSTPFILTGVGSDPDSDPITYTWEQMDPAVATMPPVSTNTGGPAFRSFKGTTNPSRYLPRLTDVVNNVTPTWEVLPSVARTLNFRLTVRDNKMGGGCTAEDNMVVTVNGTAGPFVVTSPNTAVTWPGGSPQTITWDVASTNSTPVNCANVDILMSTDGGLTFPISLATATPNDGTQSVNIPVGQTTTARIMVRANGNIFYDISNVNFTVSAPANGFAITPSPATQTVCTPSDATYSLSLAQLGTFTGNVNLSISGVPSGASAQFSPATVAVPGGSSNLNITTSGVAPGTYTLTITGTSGATTATATVGLVVNGVITTAPVLNTPANLATNIGTSPTLTWSAISGQNTYQVQISLSNTFSSTVVDVSALTTTSYTTTTVLNSGTTYYWRVRASNGCGIGPWASEFQFTTGIGAATAINYSLNTSIGTYQSIASTGTAVAIVGDDVGANITGLSPGITIAGSTYTNVRMHSNGWLALYTTTAPTANTNFAVLSSAVTNGAVLIAPMHADLNTSVAGTTSAWRQTIGGEHIFEWVNYSRYSATTSEQTDLLNFQVRLNTTTGAITLAYGNTTLSTILTSSLQVGFRSNTNTTWATHVNNLQINATGSPSSCTWENAVTGNVNSSTMYLNNANPNIKPPAGLTYQFNPIGTLSPVRTFGTVSSITDNSAVISWTAPTGATQYNVQYRISGTDCAWTNFAGNPVSGTTATLTGLNHSTKYQVRVQASNGTMNTIWSHIPTSTSGTGTDGYSSNSGTFTTLVQSFSVLTLTQTFIEGYMNGAAMRPVLLNSSVPGATSGQCDTITVALHAATSPYAQVYSAKVVLGITGAVTVNFPAAANGNNYYLVVKGRNLLETWSATPVPFSSATSYNFGAVARAYGNNMGLSGGIPVLYSGDIDASKDGNIDLLDYPVWETDYNSFSTGYFNSDLNGDGNVDLLDYPIWEAGYNNFISVQKP